MEAIDCCPQTDELDHTEHFQLLYLGHFRWFWALRVGILYLENFLDVQNHLKLSGCTKPFETTCTILCLYLCICLRKKSLVSLSFQRVLSPETLSKNWSAREKFSLSLILLAKGFDGLKSQLCKQRKGQNTYSFPISGTDRYTLQTSWQTHIHMACCLQGRGGQICIGAKKSPGRKEI